MTDTTYDPQLVAATVNVAVSTIGAEMIDGDVRVYAMPGILLHLHGYNWTPVYLPALAPHFIHGLEPRFNSHGHPQGAVVRLPEGPRGRRAKLENRVDCVVSPSAVVSCEGQDLTRELRHDEREDNLGHVWRSDSAGRRTCQRCYYSGNVKPLTAERAPPSWYEAREPAANLPQLHHLQLQHSDEHWSDRFGKVTCNIGDDNTRRKLRENTITYLSSNFGKQVYATAPQQRRAMVDRCVSPFDVGGRWLLPEDVTPETAPDFERELWVDLAVVLLDIVKAQCLDIDEASLAVWQAWLDGSETEGPPHSHWDPVFSDLTIRVFPDLVCKPGTVYLDTRRVLMALTRTDVQGRIRLAHPAEEIVRVLRSTHETKPRRGDRASLCVLMPPEAETDNATGLGVARRIWASGR